MTFLAPWALVVGAMAAMGAVVLHLVARQRPAAYLLPTTRFIPDRRTLVSRLTTRPRDLLLLALRMLLLLSAAAAFARPVPASGRAPRARLILLDRSDAVASRPDALAQVRALLTDGVPTRLIAFDTAAVSLAPSATSLDSLARDTSRVSTEASLSAALAAARRWGPTLGGEADSIELVIVSPLAARELDAATDSIRARWPGGIRLVRTAARPDSALSWTLDRTLGADDPLWPALSRARVGATPTAVRLRRTVPSASDSAFARAGGALVHWDSVGGLPLAPAALAMGDDVVVATLGRTTLAGRGRTIARWADGSPAATEEALGAGCIRRVAIGVPLAGDLPLRPAFQRVVRGLVAPCGLLRRSVLAESATVARLAGVGPVAAASAFGAPEARTSPLVPWLLGLALLCALAELLVRARTAPEPA